MSEQTRILVEDVRTMPTVRIEVAQDERGELFAVAVDEGGSRYRVAACRSVRMNDRHDEIRVVEIETFQMRTKRCP